MRGDLWLNQEMLGNCVGDLFADLYQTGKIPGQLISQGPLNVLYKLKCKEKNYYVKWYYQRGKHLRKYVGCSRLKREKENLLLFKKLGILAPTVVAFGEKTTSLLTKQGMLVTEELLNTQDLAAVASENLAYLKDRKWLMRVMQQVAEYTRCLHQNNFIHTDLKWRNILITCSEHPKVYFIDCPLGKKTTRLFLSRGKIKDLACLDKKAKYHLSKTMRLRFYFQYAGIKRLMPQDKKTIGKILKFFAGRE